MVIVQGDRSAELPEERVQAAFARAGRTIPGPEFHPWPFPPERDKAAEDAFLAQFRPSDAELIRLAVTHQGGQASDYFILRGRVHRKSSALAVGVIVIGLGVVGWWAWSLRRD